MDKLEQIAAKAARLGMSYGQYMAMCRERNLSAIAPPEESRTRPEKWETPEEDAQRQCAVCGKTLLPDTSKLTLTCGPACSYALNLKRARERYRRMHKEENSQMKECPVCKSRFRGKRKNQIYCSKQCQIKKKSAVYRRKKKGEACR